MIVDGKNNGEDAGGNSLKSPIIYISTVPNSGTGEEIKPSPQQNSGTETKFVPSLNPLKRCPGDLRLKLYMGLSENQKKILQYYREGMTQIEAAQRLNISLTTHGRELKKAKLTLGINTKDLKEVLCILHIIYGLRLPDNTITNLSYWTMMKYGQDSEVYRLLTEESRKLWKKRAEERKKITSIYQQQNGTTK